MKRLLLLGMALLAPHLRADEFRPIFNGRNLQGWDGDPRLWSVQNGILRGQSTFKALPRANSFLIWRGGTLANFELLLKFRLQSGNSGVQYRCKDLGQWSVAGYQAEIENKPGKAGFLYDEKGRKYLVHVGESRSITPANPRGDVSPLPLPKQSLIQSQYYRSGQWNEMRIVAKGTHIEHWLNGFHLLSLEDNDPAHHSLQGLLALQIHAGPPMLVEFQNILLKNL